MTRDSRASGVLITAPADGFVTNRASVRIAGRVLDPGTIASVSIGGAPVPVDASGAFDLQIALALGENVITAVATSKSGGSTSATVRVVADRTAPGLRILESGQPLADQARFPAGAALALDVSDDRALGAAVARLDGREIALPAIVSAPGGHAIVAVAVDAAGNEARVERTFFVGAAGSAGGCRLDSFVPASGSVVALATTGLTGRTGGAAGVKVNGIPASVANGSFCATVELPSEGANPIEIVCTDAGGTRVGEPARLTLVRSTAAPSVSITVPAEGAWSDKASIAVSGTSGAGVVEVTVNGERAAIGEGDPNAPRPFSVDGIRLVPGLNVILVRATTASGRSVLAARRVFYLNEPPSVTITSPLPAQQIGSAPLLLSGLWSGIDPATLVAAGSAAVPEITWSGDRSGTFLFRDLPLGPGEQTVAVSGRDVLGRVANATVLVTRDDLAPSIQITEPRDHAIFAAARPAIEIGGTAIAASGATVEVNGQRASIVSTEPLGGARVRYSFTASVPFATLGPTPLVARVTEPAGRGAYHAIRVDRLAVAPKVERVFPANAAIGIDPGAMIVVLFSSPMDRGSLRCGAGDGCAFRLEASNGSPVSGLLDLDGDAMTFAPAAPLEDGTEYTIRVTTAARDAAGGPIGSEHASRFRVGLAAAQASAPALDAFPAKHCGTMLPIAGSAPAGARVRLDVGSSAFTVTADASGRFAYDAPLTGESGFLLVRARTIASSGALSAASHSCVLVDCGGLGVASAAYDRTVNTLTITFSAPVDVATATGGAIRLVADGVAIAATIALESPSVLRVSPVEDLTRRSFTLEITTAVRALDGRPLSAPFAQP
ncbi:MAG TPA: Ig-like domain-containing protein, partial [Thermoanaerobaculia bacterium]